MAGAAGPGRTGMSRRRPCAIVRRPPMRFEPPMNGVSINPMVGHGLVMSPPNGTASGR